MPARASTPRRSNRRAMSARSWAFASISISIPPRGSSDTAISRLRGNISRFIEAHPSSPALDGDRFFCRLRKAASDSMHRPLRLTHHRQRAALRPDMSLSRARREHGVQIDAREASLDLFSPGRKAVGIPGPSSENISPQGVRQKRVIRAGKGRMIDIRAPVKGPRQSFHSLGNSRYRPPRSRAGPDRAVERRNR